jgi:hypothetical protein
MVAAERQFEIWAQQGRPTSSQTPTSQSAAARRLGPVSGVRRESVLTLTHQIDGVIAGQLVDS